MSSPPGKSLPSSPSSASSVVSVKNGSGEGVEEAEIKRVMTGRARVGEDVMEGVRDRVEVCDGV